MSIPGFVQETSAGAIPPANFQAGVPKAVRDLSTGSSSAGAAVRLLSHETVEPVHGFGEPVAEFDYGFANGGLRSTLSRTPAGERPSFTLDLRSLPGRRPSPGEAPSADPFDIIEAGPSINQHRGAPLQALCETERQAGRQSIAGETLVGSSRT